MTSESNLLFWRLEVAYFREKKWTNFLCLCWSCTVDGDPSTRPTTQINNITQLRTQNTKSAQADKSNNKAHTLMINHYSFKIFPQFWLAKNTRIFHHNQLLMTKCGRIMCLTRKWRQKCSLLQVNAPLTEKTWGRDWVVFVVKTKMADTSLVSRVRTTAGTRRNSG